MRDEFYKGVELFDGERYALPVKRERESAPFEGVAEPIRRY